MSLLGFGHWENATYLAWQAVDSSRAWSHSGFPPTWLKVTATTSTSSKFIETYFIANKMDKVESIFSFRGRFDAGRSQLGLQAKVVSTQDWNCTEQKARLKHLFSSFILNPEFPVKYFPFSKIKSESYYCKKTKPEVRICLPCNAEIWVLCQTGFLILPVADVVST